MKKSKWFLVVLCASVSLLCTTRSSCDNLPLQFSSYEEAVLKIETANFKIRDELNTSKSSWIREAAFYSCDGYSGFLIFRTDKKTYLHSNIPYSVWQNFKNAKSFGKYYNDVIKNKYTFKPIKK